MLPWNRNKSVDWGLVFNVADKYILRNVKYIIFLEKWKDTVHSGYIEKSSACVLSRISAGDFFSLRRCRCVLLQLLGTGPPR